MQKVSETERGSTRLHPVENWVCKGVRTYKKGKVINKYFIDKIFLSLKKSHNQALNLPKENLSFVNCFTSHYNQIDFLITQL